MIEKIRIFFRDIQIGIKNLIIWGPVIWKDRQWDYWFIYEIFHKKLSLMEHHIRNYGYHVRAEQDADNIKTCVLLLKRLKDDEYHENAFKQHYEKWGEPKFEWRESDRPDLSELHISHDNVKTEEDKKRERKDFKIACEREDHLKQQDLDLLFNLMRKHIQTWWD